MIKYKEFAVVTGKAEDEVSELNAFDKALMDAGIAEQNIIPVSSILAENPVELEQLPSIPVGEMIHVVMAREDGEKGDSISAGLTWALGINKNRNGVRHGIVAECMNNVNKEKLEKELDARINQMARCRNFTIDKINRKICTIDKIEKNYGCVLSVLVYRNPVKCK